MKIMYNPVGVCSQAMELDIEDGIINKLVVRGGCPGNLFGLSKLVEGMKVSEAIERLEGIECGVKKTSCPDQLAQALKSTL